MESKDKIPEEEKITEVTTGSEPIVEE